MYGANDKTAVRYANFEDQMIGDSLYQQEQQ